MLLVYSEWQALTWEVLHITNLGSKTKSLQPGTQAWHPTSMSGSG